MSNRVAFQNYLGCILAQNAWLLEIVWRDLRIVKTRRRHLLEVLGSKDELCVPLAKFARVWMPSDSMKVMISVTMPASLSSCLKSVFMLRVAVCERLQGEEDVGAGGQRLL